MTRLAMLASLCFAAVCTSAGAAPADDTEQVVTVNGIKNPEMRAYRSVAAGFDAFDNNRAFAPLAPELRFRMLPKKRASPEGSTGLALRIVGNGDPIPIEIAADGLFSVPRSEAAYDDDAELVLNRKRGLFKSLPEIRTPGLLENERRLGDLRLECRVLVAIIKTEIPFWANALINSVMLTTNWCGKEQMKLHFPSMVPLASATLIHGERRLSLEAAKWNFGVPIGDPSWPDDARIELIYAAEPSPPAPAPAPPI